MQHVTANANVPASSDVADDMIDLGQLLATIWRGKWLVALCMCLTVLAGGYYAFVQATPVYTATASVILREQQKSGSGLGALAAGLGGSGGMLAGLLDGQTAVPTEIEIITSRPLLEKLTHARNLLEDPEFNPTLRPPGVISRIKDVLGLSGDPPGPDAILQLTTGALGEALSVRSVSDTSIFDVTFETESAAKSAQLANELVELYIGDRITEQNRQNSAYVSRLSGRVRELEEKLLDAEKAVTDFNSQTDLISAEAFQVMNVQLKDLRDRLYSLQASVEQSRSRLDALGAAQEKGDLPAIAALAEDATLDDLLPAAARGEAVARERFLARTQEIVGQQAQNLARETARIQSLRLSVTHAETRVNAQAAELGRLRQLQREAGSNKAIYEFFLGRLQGSSNEMGISPDIARLLTPAVMPLRPSAPRRVVILAASMLLGGMIGSAWVLIRQMRRTGIHSAAELERMTGLPVIGQFPRIPVKRRSGVFRYLVDKPASAAAEAVRDLRTSLLLSNVDEPPTVITITSSLPGEGKTTQALALARNMAGLGKRVLLIEGDIRNRVFGEYFTTSSQKGLLSVLAGDADLETVITPVAQLGCDVLIGEHSPANAADIFSSRKFHDLLDHLRSRYEAIIIDTPPVLVVPDARVIAQNADALLYVVKWDSTPVDQVREGLKLFAAVNIPVTGLVLSQIDRQKAYGAYAPQAGTTYYQN